VTVFKRALPAWTSKLWVQALLLLAALAMFNTCQHKVSPLNLSALESELYERTNTLRKEQELTPLQPLEMLSTIARAHSEDMSKRHFFDHINPEGLAPHERLLAGLPDAVNMNSGENLAQHSQDRFDTSTLAAELMRLWIASPEHLAQLTAPNFRHLGVGVFQDEAGVLYATQTFATLVAQLTEPIPASVEASKPFSLSFTFLEAFPREELSAFLHTSNGFARIEGPSGVFYKGKGPVPIEWLDNTHFKVRIPTELGAGRYRIRLGQNGRSFEKEFVVDVS
jgi:uncharacterized protein YkwD